VSPGSIGTYPKPLLYSSLTLPLDKTHFQTKFSIDFCYISQNHLLNESILNTKVEETVKKETALLVLTQFQSFVNTKQAVSFLIVFLTVPLLYGNAFLRIFPIVYWKIDYIL